MLPESKHHLIYQALASDIGAGKYRDSGKLPSEAQLISRFKVSRPTVIRALRDLQADGLVTRRVGAGTFLNSVPAKTLPSQALPNQVLELGLLIPGVRRAGEIFEVIAGELARFARSAGHMFWWTGGTLVSLPKGIAISH